MGSIDLLLVPYTGSACANVRAHKSESVRKYNGKLKDLKIQIQSNQIGLDLLNYFLSNLTYQHN